MVLFNRQNGSKVLMFAVALMLVGCGGEPPDADGCYSETLKVAAKDVDVAKKRAAPMIDKLKEKLDKKFGAGVRYHTPVFTCVKREKKKKVSDDPEMAKQDAEKAAEKAKADKKKGKVFRTPTSDCTIVLRYCPRPPKA